MTAWLRQRRLSDTLNPVENSFGVVRLLAAVAVVLSHNVWVHSGKDVNDIVYHVSGLPLGKHAVHVFFVLSGLLVSLSLARSAGVVDYLRSRLLRIFPGFAACVMLTALVLGPAVSVLPLSEYFSSAQPLVHVVKTLSLVTAQERLPGVFVSNPFALEVNLSLWTIKYEVFCYLLLAGVSVIGFAASRARATLVFGGFVAFIIATYFFPDLVVKDSMLDSIRRFIMCFSLGALAFAHRDRIVLSPQLLLLGAAVACLAYGTRLAQPALVLVTAYSTLVLAAQSFGAFSRWTERTDLSYGIYLWGWPVAQVIMMTWPAATIWQLQISSLVMAALIAYVSWSFVERPALDLRRKFASRGVFGKIAHAT